MSLISHLGGVCLFTSVVGGTSTTSYFGFASTFVFESMTNVQSLPGPSLMASLSAVTVFTSPTAVIVFSLAAARVMPADTSIAIAIIIAARFIIILRETESAKMLAHGRRLESTGKSWR